MRENLEQRFQSIWNQACLGLDPDICMLTHQVVPHFTQRSPGLWLWPAQDITAWKCWPSPRQWLEPTTCWREDKAYWKASWNCPTGQSWLYCCCNQDYWREAVAIWCLIPSFCNPYCGQISTLPWPSFTCGKMGVNYSWLVSTLWAFVRSQVRQCKSKSYVNYRDWVQCFKQCTKEGND